MKRSMTKKNDMCAQRRLRSAWESAQSDLSLRCPHEEAQDPKLHRKRTIKTLIRLGDAGRTANLLVFLMLRLVLLYVFSCLVPGEVSEQTVKSVQRLCCVLGRQPNVPKSSSCAQRRLWSKCSKAQADLSLGCSHVCFFQVC